MYMHTSVLHGGGKVIHGGVGVGVVMRVVGTMGVGVAVAVETCTCTCGNWGLGTGLDWGIIMRCVDWGWDAMQWMFQAIYMGGGEGR